MQSFLYAFVLFDLKWLIIVKYVLTILWVLYVWNWMHIFLANLASCKFSFENWDQSFIKVFLSFTPFLSLSFFFSQNLDKNLKKKFLVSKLLFIPLCMSVYWMEVKDLLIYWIRSFCKYIIGMVIYFYRSVLINS